MSWNILIKVAFHRCLSFEALLLPLTVKSIEGKAFKYWLSIDVSIFWTTQTLAMLEIGSLVMASKAWWCRYPPVYVGVALLYEWGVILLWRVAVKWKDGWYLSWIRHHSINCANTHPSQLNRSITSVPWRKGGNNRQKNLNNTSTLVVNERIPTPQPMPLLHFSMLTWRLPFD